MTVVMGQVDLCLLEGFFEATFGSSLLHLMKDCEIEISYHYLQCLFLNSTFLWDKIRASAGLLEYLQESHCGGRELKAAGSWRTQLQR